MSPYLLSGAFAAGATSTVHLGRIRRPHGGPELVAIKRLHPHLARSAELRAVLVEEAKLTRCIAHPNVVQVLDVVATEDEVLVVMEYLRGETLERLLAAHRPSPSIAVAVVRDILHGLHAAHHARGSDGKPLRVVHRDVNPRNVLVTVEGSAKVLDFGIAKARGRVSTTRDGYTRGTLPYMAPEQVRGEEVGPAADIRAAGVVLWEALTGKRLFSGETDAAITKRILEEDVPPPSSVAADVPAALDAVVLRALARDASARHATALEMALALEQAHPPAERAEVGAWVASAVAEVLAAREREAQKLGKKSRRPIYLLPVGAALIAGGVLFAAWRIDAGEAQSGYAPTTVASASYVAVPVVSVPAPVPAPVESALPEAPPPRPPATRTTAAPKREAPCVPWFLDDAGRRRFNRECLE